MRPDIFAEMFPEIFAEIRSGARYATSGLDLPGFRFLENGNLVTSGRRKRQSMRCGKRSPRSTRSRCRDRPRYEPRYGPRYGLRYGLTHRLMSTLFTSANISANISAHTCAAVWRVGRRGQRPRAVQGDELGAAQRRQVPARLGDVRGAAVLRRRTRLFGRGVPTRRAAKDVAGNFTVSR